LTLTTSAADDVTFRLTTFSVLPAVSFGAFAQIQEIHSSDDVLLNNEDLQCYNLYLLRLCKGKNCVVTSFSPRSFPILPFYSPFISLFPFS